MEKIKFNLLTGAMGLIFGALFLLLNKLLLFGFALLFLTMFVIDSGWYFIKKKILKNSMKPIGGTNGS